MKKIFIVFTAVFISSCMISIEQEDSEPDYVPVDIMAVPNAIPKYEKRTRAGNPPGEYEVLGKRYKVLAESRGYRKTGIASWYGTKFHGRKTSNGEVYNMYAMTAAHKSLPIPSYVRVTHLKNKRSVVLRVNDRGPFHDDRIIDLSYTAAAKLGIHKMGTGLVEVTALEFDSPGTIQQADSQLSQQSAFYLQVGAFINPKSAKQVQAKLASAKISFSRIQRVQKQGKDIYKVQVGPLYSERQAQQENERLAQMGFANAQLIVED
jgi:rare lipoprotein A